MLSKDLLKTNVLHATLPYLNQGKEMMIRLISTENANKECKVNIFGFGIKERESPHYYGLPMIYANIASAFVFLACISFAGLFLFKINI